MKTNGEYVFKDCDLMDMSHVNDYMVMAILRKHGMPTVGTTSLKIDPSYSLHVYRDYEKLATIYTWREKHED